MAVEISAKSSRLVAFCAGSLDREYLDPLIYRVGIDLFHVVILGLGKVDTRDTLLRRQDVNIVISSAAEVYYATAEALQEQIVVGDRKLAIQLRREIHCAVASQHDLTEIVERRPMCVHHLVCGMESIPFVHEFRVGLGDKRERVMNQFGLVVE